MNRILILIAASSLASVAAFGQTNDTTTPPTNSILWAAAPVGTKAVHPADGFQDIMFGLGRRVNIGATESIRITSGLQGAASVSVLGVVKGMTNQVTAKYSVFWQVGVAYTYVPAWGENDVGIGATLDVLRLSDSIETGIAGAVNKVPVAGTVAPKLTVLKWFVAVETPVDQITRDQEFRVVTGLGVPLGT